MWDQVFVEDSKASQLSLMAAHWETEAQRWEGTELNHMLGK
jgi:hypothetical protein